jgi:hypothetical protein
VKKGLLLLIEAVLVRLRLLDPFEIRHIAGFLSDADKEILSRHARSLQSESTIVEIGSFLGLSAVIMGSSTRKCKVICIDPCDLSGDDDSTPGYREVGYRGSGQFNRLRLHLVLYGVDARVIRATSGMAIEAFYCNHQLLFIDGDHSYHGCCFDVNSYSRYLDIGGILILHDATELGWPGPIAVALELLESTSWKLIERGGNCVVFQKMS